MKNPRVHIKKSDTGDYPPIPKPLPAPPPAPALKDFKELTRAQKEAPTITVTEELADFIWAQLPLHVKAALLASMG